MARYPGDVSALAPLYLNVVTLAPGQALFLPAGELHAYLEGTALEIMANSDNVLRGGLTPKHVDVPELLAILVFEGRSPEVLEAAESGPGERVYRTPAREFELALLDVERRPPVPGRPRPRGRDPPGARGAARLLAGGQATPLGPGRSVARPRLPSTPTRSRARPRLPRPRPRLAAAAALRF